LTYYCGGQFVGLDVCDELIIGLVCTVYFITFIDLLITTAADIL